MHNGLCKLRAGSRSLEYDPANGQPACEAARNAEDLQRGVRHQKSRTLVYRLQRPADQGRTPRDRNRRTSQTTLDCSNRRLERGGFSQGLRRLDRNRCSTNGVATLGRVIQEQDAAYPNKARSTGYHVQVSERGTGLDGNRYPGGLA